MFIHCRHVLSTAVADGAWLGLGRLQANCTTQQHVVEPAMCH